MLPLIVAVLNRDYDMGYYYPYEGLSVEAKIEMILPHKGNMGIANFLVVLIQRVISYQELP